MGFLKLLFGGGFRQITGGIAQVGRVFQGDAAARDQQNADAYAAALTQYGAEFNHRQGGWFNSLVDGFNRLPRPILTFATIGLFAYAMAEPIGFTARMQGLSHIPEPLWWLMTAIIGFYFSARELHHFRNVTPSSADDIRATVQTIREIEAINDPPVESPVDEGGNAALKAWRDKAANP